MTPEPTPWQAALDAWGHQRPALALARLRRVLGGDPHHWPARLLAAKVLTDLARYDDAQAMLESLADDPAAAAKGRGMVLLAIAELHDRAGDHEAALRAYQRLREHAPADTDAYVYGGGVLARLGRLAEAEALYRAGTACTSGAVDECWYNVGLVLRAQERHGDAAVAFARALELDPDYAAATAALADVTAAATLG